MPAFTGGQIMKWLYEQHVKSIDEMTNILKANRATSLPNTKWDASDIPIRNIRWMVPSSTSSYPKGKFVETVYIPDKDRATLRVLRRWDAR